MADEEARLRARIAAVAGAINLRKQQLAADPTAPVQSQQFYNNPAPAHRGGYQQYQHSNRWAPFPASGGRGRGAYGTTFQNRTLVNATAGVTPPPTPPAQAPQQQHRNLQNRPDAMRFSQPPRATVPSRELTIEGVRFTLKEDGSKLTRVPDSSPGTPTPPKAVVAGVQFLRTKNGNLLRAATTNTASKPPNKPIVQCENFIKNGSCPFGIKCRFDHNPNKVSMCKTFFHKGICASGDLCDLSHKPTYNRVPACTHFINGNCTNEACRYAHVSPSTSTFICRPFALLGYCEKGVECDRRHVFECPDFAETGDCANKKCKLNHIRHAHIERQKAGADDDSELEEDEDEMSKDPDSGGLNELAANQDFISFS